MAKARPSQPLVPSVLDRLLDDQPTAKREPARSRGQVLRELKQRVRRDLENLLNTRRRVTTWPENLTELEISLANYGMPDITATDPGSAERRRALQQIIERVIRDFEPRFKRLSVEALDNVEPLDRTLRFRIDALLHAEPAPEPVVFDSLLEPNSGNVQVKGASR